MLTKDKIDKHALQAVDCPPATWVVLRSAMHRLVDKESAATAPLLARIAELERQLEEARKDAELGRTAMRFVDRAGDPHPGIDDADKICAEFYAAMCAVVEEQT